MLFVCLNESILVVFCIVLRFSSSGFRQGRDLGSEIKEKEICEIRILLMFVVWYRYPKHERKPNF